MIFRFFSSIILLAAIILSIPLAFDVGGRSCGLAFSLSLASFFFIFSVLRLTTPPRSVVRNSVIILIGSMQWLAVPILLIWSLNRFSTDLDTSSTLGDRMFSSNTSRRIPIFQQSIFGPDGLLEIAAVGGWDKLLSWSVPVFQLAEGFCSLLVIQAAGRITKSIVNRSGKSDSWMIGLLVLSASIISCSIYFLWRILRFPEISSIDFALIGVTVTCSVALCAWGIGSGWGNPVESSLLFSYVVLSLYQIFTNTRSVPPEAASPTQQAHTPEFPPLPPLIMASYSTLLHSLSALPSVIHTAFNAVSAASIAISPLVVVSLFYRLFALYASTKIIPSVRESGARALTQDQFLEISDGTNHLLELLGWFLPSILVAVYTSLIMQHFASISQLEEANGAWSAIQRGSGNIWRWLNLGGTMALYAIELWLGRHNDINTTLSGHWKRE